MIGSNDIEEAKLFHQGKVRDVFYYGKDFLIVATDRISAFDYVLGSVIPDKGRILHKLSMFWFDYVQNIVPNHIITGDFKRFPEELKKYNDFRGNPCKDLRDYLEHFNKHEFKNLIKYRKTSIKFWKEIKKNDDKGTYLYSEYQFRYLNLRNFFLASGFYNYNNLLENVLVQEKENIIIKITRNKEKDTLAFIKNYIIEDFLHRRYYHEDFMEFISKGRDRFFPISSISDLPIREIDFEYSGEDYQYLFFKNTALQISKKEISEKKYNSIEKKVWKEKIKDFNFKKVPNMFTVKPAGDSWDISINPNHGCDYFQFLINSSNPYWRKSKDWSKLNYEEVVECQHYLVNKIYALGYLLHRHKRDDRPWAVMSLDLRESNPDESNGRSGKSLFGKSLKMVANYIERNGKNSKLFENNHVFGDVNEQTDIIHIQDASRYFNMDFLYNFITNDFDVNPKFSSGFTIPFQKSPKIYISSNFSLNSDNDSTIGRILHIGFSDYYHIKGKIHDENCTPMTEFKKIFFGKGFTDNDWNLFYNFIAQAIKFYLNHDRIDPPLDSIRRKYLKNICGTEFIDWAVSFFSLPENLNSKIDLKETSNNFINSLSANQSRKEGMSKFKKRLEAYCEFKNWKLNPREVCCKSSDYTRILSNSGEKIYIQTKEENENEN